MGKITYEEREQIFTLSLKNKGVREISRILGRSPSSVSTELRRQGQDIKNYDPLIAQKHADLRKSRSRRPKKIEGCLKECVELLLLEQRFSPEQISCYLKKQYPDLKELRVSPETIYRHVYNSPKRKIFIKALRQKRKLRRKSKPPHSRGGIKNKISIHTRPQEVEDRKVVGHWEGDLIIGKEHQSAIGTLLERSTRYIKIIPIDGIINSKNVVEAFSKAFEDLPADLKRSLTYDQGIEMALHELFSQTTGIPVYFADKGCPWQRGSNENSNGLIRDFLPKGTDFNKVTPEYLQKVECLLNNRPRKILDFETPAAMFATCLKV